MKKEAMSKGILLTMVLLALSTAALAADPGHSASSIGQGIFEAGNITVQGNFSIGGGVLC